MTVIPLHRLWIDANFKEVQLHKMRIGQPAVIRVDMYGGDVTYHGRVTGFSAGTGSAFSLLPPQNATGNWIKIVQRVPVRIEIDPADLREHPLLVGGGVGIPPLYGLAKRLTAQGKRVTAVLGFNRKSEIFLAEEFRALGAEVVIATADGSVGLKGLVTDGMAAVSDYTYLYTCGPEPMLKAMYADCKTSGQFSFEERMGCGFGACMGCSVPTGNGYKRVCKDGPILYKEEIVW